MDENDLAFSQFILREVVVENGEQAAWREPPHSAMAAHDGRVAMLRVRSGRAAGP